MKHQLVFFAFLFALFACTKHHEIDSPAKIEEQQDKLLDYNGDITIANWNIEWFGDGKMFDGNLDKQETNAGKILKYLDADLYGLCEIVDTVRFGRMIRDNFSKEYNYKISSYLGAQKLAFLYNKNIFRNVTVRPFMGLSSAAYYNFGNRYPYLLAADVAINGSQHHVDFVLLHAKANADITSYNRRVNASLELKDSLDHYFEGKYFFILGDFNDNFDKSICVGKQSPYQNFLDDKSNYECLTLPLKKQGNQSTLAFSNSVIDQQIISNKLLNWYSNASAKIRTDVTNVIPNFKTGNTSDHYPITSVFQIIK